MTDVRLGNAHGLERRRLVASALLSAFLMALSGCGGQDSHDKPAGNTQDAVREASETVDDLLELARAGDWRTYVDRHYGEAHKFRSDADRDKLVHRFENQWGDRIIASLERVAPLTPAIEADKAIFRDGNDVLFVLYRASDGKWKFHL